MCEVRQRRGKRMENRVSTVRTVNRFYISHDAKAGDVSATIYDSLYSGEYCVCAAEDAEFICAAINSHDRMSIQ